MAEQTTTLSEEVQFVQFWLTRAKASYPTDPAEARKCLEEADQYVQYFGITFSGTVDQQWKAECELRRESLRLWLSLFGQRDEFLRRIREDHYYEWLHYANCLKEADLPGCKEEIKALLHALTKKFTKTNELLPIVSVGSNLLKEDYHEERLRVLGLAEANAVSHVPWDLCYCADAWRYCGYDAEATRCMMSAEKASTIPSQMAYCGKYWRHIFPETHTEHSERCLKRAEEMATCWVDLCDVAKEWKIVFNANETAARLMLEAEAKANSRDAWLCLSETWLDAFCDPSAYIRCLERAEAYPDTARD